MMVGLEEKAPAPDARDTWEKRKNLIGQEKKKSELSFPL